MAKKNNDYFKLIGNQISYCVKASELLGEILTKYEHSNIDIYRKKMQEIEHDADEIYHNILNMLSTEFITPIDQEDIVSIVQIVDDITDAIDEVVIDLYMYGISCITTQAQELSNIVARCVIALYASSSELKNFKKPDALRAHLVVVNDIESEADDVYVGAIHELFENETDTKRLIGIRAVYESLEECCDLCEHAANVIEQIIIKNT